MNFFEREEMDAEYFAMSEHQNAYAISMMEREGDDPRVAAALSDGKHALVFRSIEYCPRTDASMGARLRLVSAHATRAEAIAAYEVAADEEGSQDSDGWFVILPEPPAAPVAPRVLSDNEIPF